ncbi:photosystem II assembly protein Psb35 [Leptothoe spongobia]|uniref:Uncharacterized protein n=1 Tax=Leptothoe spongobia TAU-MAC 1115 TaxID=1967444 RepID=A0A947DGX0_9CYAN|nr:hypothetical protein [Leptothoe spongobia]MBT9315726.1 hypothetical protein [Leptothoe spongobia TAU-MAC 1115]
MVLAFGEVGASGIPMYYFQLVYVVGFIAAIGIGSLAWYNSKRPPGWEDAARPDFIPDIEPQEADSQSED